MLRTLFTFLSLFAILGSLSAQTPVRWRHEAKALGNGQYSITFKAKIEKGWYVYSQYLPSEDGPVATSVTIEEGEFTPVGKASESSSDPANKKSGFDEIFEMQVAKYKNDLQIVKTVATPNKQQHLVGYLEFMTCNDQSCLPPTSYEFDIDLAALPQPKAIAPASEDGKSGQVAPKAKDASNTTAQLDPAAETPKEEVAVEEETAPNSSAVEGQPISWSYEKRLIEGNSYELIFRAEMSEGWHTYSQFLEGEDGPVATKLNFVEGDHFKLLSGPTESTNDPKNKVSGFDPLFDMKLTKYKNQLEIRQRVEVLDSSKALEGFLTYMICDKEQCLPPTDLEFSFFKAAAATTAKLDPNKVLTGIDRPDIRSSLKAASARGNCGTEVESANLSLWMIFFFGFIGGLFALLTPCVFPMIPLTVSFFTKRSQSKAAGIRNATIYGLSIIGIYVALGMFVTVVFGENALNWLSTHWIPNLSFFILFITFAISFFGYYEITLPSSWSNGTDKAADRGGLLGIFFMAFTLSLVSFSCTGPIIGTLLVQAAEGGQLAPAVGMLGFSSALALPFALFSAFPGWLNSLPRSGGWMNVVKVVLGFVEVALAFKFLSKADMTMHWELLKYETFLGIYVVVAFAMGIYLLGFIRFPHDMKGAKIGLPRKGLGLFSIALATYFALGFTVDEKTGTYATPPIMSGLAPPACYSYYHPCDCPAGLQNCFHDYEEGLAYAREQKLPIMIDFTGYGCENCRKMEDQVWVKPEINKILNEEYVLISLYVDDRTKLEKTLTAPDGQKIRNVGNKWAAFERLNFGQVSQPLYVLMAPDETILNTPVGAVFDADKYQEFLECGLSNYALWGKGELK